MYRRLGCGLESIWTFRGRENFARAGIRTLYRPAHNTLGTGDADLRFYITTVQDG